jgi:GTP-binding protein HflX
VGFISDLPTELVAAFRATLEEVLSADLILHVRDIAHPETEEQAEDVRAILENLGVDANVPLFEVWNKTDMLTPEARAALVPPAGHEPRVLALSALSGEGTAALLEAVADALDTERTEDEMFVPFTDGRTRALLHDMGVVLSEVASEDGHRIRVRWTERQRARAGR